ncbi:thiamine diphosphokinase [Bengtsoniella intestinalis]|uniref:thiamine diphosphokinase n=1 Tax=Bengtsoniella intestinalis TaxID=3073143 RepID=UPI00391F976E
MRGFIFGAGSFYGLEERPTQDDYIVAADGGYETCLLAGITPSVVVGDFDSMAKPTDFPNIIQVPVEKDDTDSMLAIKLALDKGCKEIYLYGVTGGDRLDHTIAAFQNLLYIRRCGAKGCVYDKGFCFTAIEAETVVLESHVEWGLLSIFAINGQADGVTIAGAQYTLDNGTLHPHIPMGVSNHFQGKPVTIGVKSGALLVGWELATTK